MALAENRIAIYQTPGHWVRLFETISTFYFEYL
jgi:hypothetical protein